MKNMTEEDKELLFVDLCARLPYNTIVRSFIGESGEQDEILGCVHIINFYAYDCRPYLRPIISMTEDEFKKLDELIRLYRWNVVDKLSVFCKTLDYLNSIHVDYRGLIEKGLAIEAPEGMYSN